MEPHRKLIEEYNHRTAGYNPFLISGNWQVAKLNYHKKNAVENIHQIEVHYRTDEAFVLLMGNAVIVGADKDADKLCFDMVSMKKSIVYNVPRGVWHTIIMGEKAEVLIIENANTHLGDCELYEMTEYQRKTLRKALALCVKNSYNELMN